MTSLAQRTFDDTKTWGDVERDLTFRPARTEHPKRLTREQIAAYNANGYLKGIRIFSDDEVLRHREYFDRLLAKQMADGGDSYSLRRLLRFCQPVWDIATNPLVLDYVEDLLGPDIVAWGTQYFCKLPGDGKVVSWHQDASYWPMTPAHTMTLWLAVDDADRANGCMKVIPGTHTLGQLDFDMGGIGENSVLPQKVKDADRLGEADYLELKAGEISLHADMLVHGSDANTSDRRRCGLTIRYAATSVRALDPEWAINNVVARGSDPDHHWTNNPRPARDILDT